MELIKSMFELLMKAIDPAFVAVIVAGTEGLKQLIGKYFPKWSINGRVITITVTSLLIVYQYLINSGLSDGTVGALLFSFLSSILVYDFGVEPVKGLWKWLNEKFGLFNKAS